MLYRAIALPLHRAVQLGAPVLLQGPRSAGKTELLQREFPAHSYVTLDNAADRARARTHPATFLARLRGPAIIDDLHRAPELIAHLEGAPEGPLILASSRRLSLPVETLELYPPTRAELQRRAPVSLEMLGRFVPAAVPGVAPFAPWEARRHFIDHDLRDLVSIHDLDRFAAFLAAARERTAQILDQQALADACGLSHRTVVRWLAALDSCFQILRLPPADVDFGRRLIRRHKLHFLEGEALESQAVSEIFRNAKHAGESPDLRYWRDSNGFEIPLVIQSETAAVMAVGIAAAPNPADVNRLRRWMELSGTTQAALIGKAKGTARTGGVLRYSLEAL